MNTATNQVKEKSKISFLVLAVIFSLSMCYSVMYSLPYVKAVFYDGMLALTGATNTQLGLLMTVYGIGEVLTPAIGGVLAMKVDYKKIIVFSASASVISCLLLALFPSYFMTIIAWVILVFSTLFMVWGTWFKALRIIATDDQQSVMTGLFYGCNGIAYFVINTLSAGVYDEVSTQTIESGLSQLTADRNGMVAVFYTFAAFLAVFAIVAGILMKKLGVVNQGAVDADIELAKEKQSILHSFLKVAKHRSVWYFGISLFCMYSATISIQYFTPYFTDVMGVTVTASALIAIIRQYGTRIAASPLGGHLAKKTNSISIVIVWAFSLTALTLITVLLLPAGWRTVGVLTGILIFAAFLNNISIGIQYAIPTEANIPIQDYAAAVGFGSALGFAPDLYQHALFGYWIDKYENVGYNYIMLYGVIVSIIGALALIKFLAEKKSGKTL